MTRVLLIGFIVINSTLLMSTNLIPAGNGEAEATRSLKRLKGNKPVAYFKESNPYNPWGLNMYFYEPIQNSYHLESTDELEKLKIANPDMIICVRNKYLSEESLVSVVENLNMKIVNQTTPNWMNSLFQIYGYKADDDFSFLR